MSYVYYPTRNTHNGRRLIMIPIKLFKNLQKPNTKKTIKSPPNKNMNKRKKNSKLKNKKKIPIKSLNKMKGRKKKLEIYIYIYIAYICHINNCCKSLISLDSLSFKNYTNFRTLINPKKIT
jgi:hypothetical protein